MSHVRGNRIGGRVAQGFVAIALTLPYVGGFPLAYVLMLATIGFTIWVLATLRSIPLPDEPATRLLLAAYGLLALAFCLSARQPSDLAALVNFLILLFFLPLATALKRFSAPANALHVAYFGLAGSALALAVAVYQVGFLGMDRAAGYFSDEIWSADAALVIGFLAFIGATVASGWRRPAFVLGPVLALVVVLLSGSRGPTLAFPILLIIASVIAFRRRYAAILAGTAAAVALALILFALWPEGATRLSTLLKLSNEMASGQELSEQSGAIRMTLMRASWEAFWASPWIGHGWGRFGEAIAPYAGQAEWGVTAQHFHLHSDLANFAVGAGGLGILAYGAILIAPFAGALASPRDSQFRARLMSTALLGAAYFLCGLTNTMFGFEFHTTLYVCLAAILLFYCRDVPDRVAR